MGLGGLSIWQLLIVLVMLLSALLPCVLALISSRVAGTEKFVWFLLAFVFSWLGYFVFYFVVARKRPVAGSNGRIG